MEIESTPKPFVFVLMPFAKSFDDVYKLGIKAACEEEGAYCERVDEQQFDGSVRERIYNQIAKADIIISEMTGKNANVFYETGYAHALGKRVILSTKDSEDIPFDLRDYPHIIYEGRINDLKVELRKKLRWSIENPTRPFSTAEPNLRYYVAGLDLESSPTANIWPVFRDRSRPLARIEIGVHNPTSKTFASRIDFGIQAEKLDVALEPARTVVLPDKDYLHLVQADLRIVPDCWSHIRWELSASRAKLREEYFDLQLLVFSELDVKRFPFSIRVN
jgi:hypothetical protein